MEPSGIISGVPSIGLLIGALARLVTPKAAPLGCLLTLLIGVVGGAVGAAIGHAQNWGFWVTCAVQVLIAAVIVAVFSAATRPR